VARCRERRRLRSLAAGADRGPSRREREARLRHADRLHSRPWLAAASAMKRLPATTVFYGLELLNRVPTWVVMSVYLVRELHLSPLQLVLMGTAMEGAVFLFEVPTGVVADTYSRRLSLIIGYLGMGVALITDGVGAENLGTLFLRGRKLGYLGAVTGLGLQVGVGTQSLRAGVIVGGAFTILCGLVCKQTSPH